MLFVLTGLRAEQTPAAVAAQPTGAQAPTVAATPTTAVVQVQRAPESAPPPKAMTPEELLKRFDKNGDGKLDDDEREDAHEAMLQQQMAREAARANEAAQRGQPSFEDFRRRMLEMFDKNHDGRLDDEERAEARRYAEEHGLLVAGMTPQELLKRFDKNGDGKLDADERAEMRKALRASGGGGAPLMAMRQEILRRYDKNGDGRIDDAEWAELEPVLRERIENAPRQLQRYDKNGDGVLDDQEWAAAAQQIRQWLNQPPAVPAPATTGAPAPTPAQPTAAGKL